MTLKEKIDEFSREAFDIDNEDIAEALNRIDLKELSDRESIAFCRGVEWVCNNTVKLMEEYKIDIDL